MPDTDSVARRHQALQERIVRACRRAGREPAAVRLVAVAKRHPAEAVRAAAALGLRDFAENRAQEAAAKIPLLADLALDWHFVGRLQRNKAQVVARHCAWAHSVDSLRLAQTLNRLLPEERRLKVLLQVNVGEEPQKTGVAVEELEALAAGVRELPRLDLRGLMTLPPFREDPEEVRPYFRRLRECRDQLQDRLSLELPELSMGMTHDYPAAIGEGATMIRIGTALFGPRPPQPK